MKEDAGLFALAPASAGWPVDSFPSVRPGHATSYALFLKPVVIISVLPDHERILQGILNLEPIGSLAPKFQIPSRQRCLPGNDREGMHTWTHAQVQSAGQHAGRNFYL